MYNSGPQSEGQRGLLELDVQCYAGYRGEETPRRFSFHERSVEVIDVLDAWLAPDHRYFKVRGNDGGCYILRNDVASGRWELTMYDGVGAIGGLALVHPRGAQPGK